MNMDATLSLADAKKQLRASVIAARDAMTPAARAVASEAIINRVIGLNAYRNAEIVMTYMSFGAELDTHGFLEHVLRGGKMAVLPRIGTASRSLSLHRIASRADLVEGVWGIREPRPDAPVVSISAIDLLLMPGLAFDRRGNRLGYGAGYYDRLLAQASEKPLRVAAAFDCQLVESVPAGPADQPFHILATESQLLHIPQ